MRWMRCGQGETMHINWQLRELNLKVVYYGPALSGKTTNLEQIHARVNPAQRSELVSLKTHEDRTLFFDFLQLELGKIGGLTPKIHLYTVPGQTYYEASRRLVLRGADGVVFVVDSAAPRLHENLESWKNMLTHLRSFDIDPQGMPIVVQLNKQDLYNALKPPAIRTLLHLNGLPTVEAVAMNGQGVLETLKAITRAVIAQVQRQMA
ncbi:MAG: ADP-ribosylation factor-like protein [Chloroflexota bacterium]